MMSNTIRSK